MPVVSYCDRDGICVLGTQGECNCIATVLKRARIRKSNNNTNLLYHALYSWLGFEHNRMLESEAIVRMDVRVKGDSLHSNRY